MKFTDCIEIVGSKPTLYEGTKQYVSTGAVEEYFINKNSIEEYTYNERPSRADLVGKSGDILFAKMAETKKTLILDKETENYLFSTGFFAIRPKSGILTTKCLYYLLNSKNFLNQKDKNSSGATQKAITNAGLEKINVNIPLFSKQDQIVKQFDLLTDIIKKYQSQLKKLDSLIKSRFIEMFGDPVSNPMGWEVKKLGNICTKISDGVHAKPEYTSTGKPFISVVNINSGKLLFDDCKYVSEEAYEKMIKSTHPEKGDVLYTKVGATYGIPALVDTDKDFCLYVSVALLKPKSEIVNSQFLTISMAQPYIKNQADKRIKGIGVPDLHLNQIREFDILLPPLELQNQFKDFVQQIDKSKFEIWLTLQNYGIIEKRVF